MRQLKIRRESKLTDGTHTRFEDIATLNIEGDDGIAMMYEPAGPEMLYIGVTPADPPTAETIKRLEEELELERERLNFWSSHSLDHCVHVGAGKSYHVAILDDECIRESIDDAMRRDDE